MCLLVAVLVAPAMAAVTISVVPGVTPCTADIVAVADGADADTNGSLVAGIALDVSVSAGVILDVYNFKTTGESVAGDKGYGIFLGTMTFTGGDPEEILNTGTPVAPSSAPDNPGQLGSSAIVLELGALYDQATPEAAPDGTTVLCTILASENCTMTLAANATRGGVVLIGGGAPSALSLVPGAITCVIAPCYVGPHQAQHQLYINAGYTREQMACWCNNYQCQGDAAGEKNALGYRVYTLDLNALAASWRAKLGDANLNPCADVVHDTNALGYRVYTTDLNLLAGNWRKKDTDLAGGCNVAP